MSQRFINCSACGGCHTGRGGQFCKFYQAPDTSRQTAGSLNMALSSPLPPDRDTPEYLEYLAKKISEEEERLHSLQNKCKVVEMEEQLSRLRIKSAALSNTSDSVPGSEAIHTGVASHLLLAAK